MRTAIGSMPIVALMTIAAVSTASSAGIDWPTKSAAPGVSIRWMRVSACFRCITDEFSECCRRRSSGSWSLTVEPRSRLPGAAIMPAFRSMASDRLVFPAAAGPTKANVRIAASAGVAPGAEVPAAVAPAAGRSGLDMVGLLLMKPAYA
jgi:hypothetical protein